MSRKGSRAGGKYTSSHTTVIPAAGEIADIASNCVSVTKISLGFIKAGLPGAKGIKRLKVTIGDGSIVFSVRDNTSLQELRVYVLDMPNALKIIRTEARKKGFVISS